MLSHTTNMPSLSIYAMMKGWFLGVRAALRSEEDPFSKWGLAEIGGCAGFLSALVKRILFAGFACILALGGAIAGMIHGAIKGQTTETGFLKGAITGGLAGAVAAIQLLESAVDGEPFSKIAVLRTLVNGKVFMEFVSPAVLKAYQCQVSTLENHYIEFADIYATATMKGLSHISIQKLPSHKYGSTNYDTNLLHSHDEFCCSICLQELKGGDSVRRLPKCGHFFHLDCIDQWLMRQGSCPICRIYVCNDRNEL
ncbi:NEP1-interacting protein-like 1 [Humulus lupulus]|uniref:NEP1-interacting protein-like 1 n=1 Tax=Humulus lupulus TaxID=3486 RepID=UPI002B411548|nr:NEP1-interacting protein-like 1 [Humulus lupulus]